MNLTNKLGLPDALVAAISNDDYSRGDADLSVTQLIAPPRQVELKRRHASEVVEDAADRIWLLLGKSVHKILEAAASTGIREERMYTEVSGMKVSGAFDHLALGDGMLSDYKVTSVWSAKNAADKAEWEQQLNLYAYLAAEQGYSVKGLRIVAICRDWRMSDAAKYEGDGYPQHQVAVIEFPLWDKARQYDYLRERVQLHQSARDGNLPDCTDEERWQKPGGYALVKPGSQRAWRVLATEEEAQALASKTKDMRVVYRPGVNTRCDSYCAVAEFCTQYQALRAQQQAVA